jgi:hypothetical protein
VTAPLADVLGVVDRAPVTAWMAQVIAAAGLPVGVNDLPAGAALPYLVVADVDGGEQWGPPLGSAAAAVGLVFQVDAIGRRQDQARALADRARRAVLGRAASGGWAVDPDPPAGLRIVHRDFDGGTPDGSPTPEGTDPNRVWTAQQRFRIQVETTGG